MRREELIIDVGMHLGEDTAYYLEKGFRVVAIEANPELVDAGKQRFAAEIAEGRLEIRGVAIAKEAGTEQLAVADDATIWSSLSPELIDRNRALGTSYKYVEVPACRFEDILGEVGIPYYLKVDIEGQDMLCVSALHSFEGRPRFLSLESGLNVASTGPGAVRAELAHLWALGYRSFKYVDQMANPSYRCPFPAREGRYVNATFTREASGPFGEETPGRWRGMGHALLQSELLRRQQDFAGLGATRAQSLPSKAYRGLRRMLLRRRLGWYDLHARLGP